jgi:hypothetical protein
MQLQVALEVPAVGGGDLRGCNAASKAIQRGDVRVPDVAKDFFNGGHAWGVNVAEDILDVWDGGLAQIEAGCNEKKTRHIAQFKDLSFGDNSLITACNTSKDSRCSSLLSTQHGEARC